jgi:hypothetical protein
MASGFDHYRILFANKGYIPNDQSYVEALVYATPGHKQFSFPDLKTDFGITGFDLNSFKLRHVQFYKYDGKAALKNQFNSFTTLVQEPGIKSVVMGSVTFN